MSTKTPVIVYWSPYARLDRLSYVNLISEQPKKLYSTLPPPIMGELKNAASYHLCKSLQKLTKNMYVISAPLSASANLSGNFDNSFINSSDGVWNNRVGSMSGTYSIDYDFSWIFFAEEPVVIRQTPPYFHNTSSSLHGYVTSGSFDIDKWFRPINVTFNLWDGVNTINVTKDEPLFYVEFETKDGRPVVLKQFELTQELYDYCYQATVLTKPVLPLASLDNLYSRFKNSNRDKKILKIIKDNLLN